MENAKRRCLESVQNQQNTGSSVDVVSCDFISLNDDCILKIFEYFELNELCVVGKTCKKLQHLVERFFLQRFRNKMMCEVRIQVTFFDREIILLPDEAYVMDFLKYMQNIRICEGFKKQPLDITEFIRKNLSDHFEYISFENIKFNKLHGALLHEWLSTVNGLAFFSCENVHQILKYCVNVKYLKLDKYSKDQSNQWMMEKYPKIQHLQFDLSLNHKLIEFLYRNPNVKSLMINLTNMVRSVPQRQFVDQLCYIKLEELFINFANLEDFQLVGSQLKAVCNQTQFKRLELAFTSNILMPYFGNDTGFTLLKDLKHLTGLHFLRCGYLPSEVILEHLNVLQLSNGSSIGTDDLSKNLPNLEELYLSFLSGNFRDLVTPFARHAVKLKKVVARDFKIPNRKEMTSFFLAEHFNVEREQLANACKLFIYIDKEVFHQTSDQMTAKLPLVEIKRVEFNFTEVDFAKPFLSNFQF